MEGCQHTIYTVVAPHRLLCPAPCVPLKHASRLYISHWWCLCGIRRWNARFVKVLLPNSCSSLNYCPSIQTHLKQFYTVASTRSHSRGITWYTHSSWVHTDTLPKQLLNTGSHIICTGIGRLPINLLVLLKLVSHLLHHSRHKVQPVWPWCWRLAAEEGGLWYTAHNGGYSKDTETEFTPKGLWIQRGQSLGEQSCSPSSWSADRSHPAKEEWPGAMFGLNHRWPVPQHSHSPQPKRYTAPIT